MRADLEYKKWSQKTMELYPQKYWEEKELKHPSGLAFCIHWQYSKKIRENEEHLDNRIKGNTDIIQQQQNHIKETTKENSSYREIVAILEENKSNRKSIYVGKCECWFIKSTIKSMVM